MTVTAMRANERLDIGKVFQQTWAPVQQNFGLFFLIAFLLGGLPPLLVGLGQLASKVSPVFSIISFVAILAGLVTALIMQGSLIYAAAQSLDGRSPPMAECLSVGSKHWLPLLGMAILTIIAVEIGFMFFVVPGVLLAVRWAVAGPAIVLEGRGVFASMGRSAVLTKGRRGGLFLLFLIVMIGLLVLDVLLAGLFRGSGVLRFNPQDPGQFKSQMTGFYLFLAPVFNIVFGILGSSFFAALFHQLRSTREGGTPEAMAEVFA